MCVEVHRHHAAPFLWRHRVERRDRIDAGGVDQDVDATEPLLDPAGDRCPVGLVRHVRGQGDRPIADGLGDVRRLDAVDDHHHRAALGEKIGYAAPDALTATGNDRDFALMRCHVLLLVR
jgi:hypothetical protein